MSLVHSTSGSSEEIVRASLCALAFKDRESAVPVHIHRLRHLCYKFGFEEDLIPVLRSKLMLIRECQDLGHGFWFPIPPRIVPLDGVNLIVAPCTTEELKFTVSKKIELAGVGRVLDHQYSCDLRVQSFESWCRAPSSLSDWATKTINELRNKLYPTLHPEGLVEVYIDWQPFGCNSRETIVGRWRNVTSLKKNTDKNVGLCRLRVGQVWRYFFGAFKDGWITHEAHIDKSCDLNRLIHGLDFLSGNYHKLFFEKSKGAISFSLPRAIPKEEYRLVVALCRKLNVEGKSAKFILDEKFSGNVQKSLEKLGYCWREF